MSNQNIIYTPEMAKIDKSKIADQYRAVMARAGKSCPGRCSEYEYMGDTNFAQMSYDDLSNFDKSGGCCYYSKVLYGDIVSRYCGKFLSPKANEKDKSELSKLEKEFNAVKVKAEEGYEQLLKTREGQKVY
jgi:hypothetical protein